jgi:hypothetical protein
MAFDGKEGEEITMETASSWTENYRNQMVSGDLKGHFFGKDHFNAILEQTDCVGIRIYNGMDDNGKPVLILVGAKVNEDDLVDGIIVDRAISCPDKCGRANDLNS